VLNGPTTFDYVSPSLRKTGASALMNLDMPNEAQPCKLKSEESTSDRGSGYGGPDSERPTVGSHWFSRYMFMQQTKGC